MLDGPPETLLPEVTGNPRDGGNPPGADGGVRGGTGDLLMADLSRILFVE